MSYTLLYFPDHARTVKCFANCRVPMEGGEGCPEVLLSGGFAARRQLISFSWYSGSFLDSETNWIVSQRRCREAWQPRALKSNQPEE